LNGQTKGSPEREDWQICQAVQSAANAVRAFPARHATLFVFTVCMDRVGVSEAHTDVSNWHTMVVHLKNKVMGVYDPSYQPNRFQRLSELPNKNTVRKFIAELRKRSITVEKVYVGGGGNIGGNQCNEMCRQWLISEFLVEDRRGLRLGNWEDFGWTVYKPN
jgi:hypothetical protein